MNILLLGSGGREHALAWAIAASPLVDTLIAAPGNAGIEEICRCVAVDPLDFEGVLRICRSEAIDLVVVGPEAPLVAGIADFLSGHGIKVFGPSKAAAALEASKGYVKDLCREHGIPTADYARFEDPAAAIAHLDRMAPPYVVKADGLAAGKGVIIAATRAEAEAAIGDMFAGKFGEAGQSVVLEEYLAGEEASYFALVDGEHILPLATAQDHKRIGEGDTGPNTGGMGAYSPAPVLTPALCEATLERIVRPTVAAMRARGAPYTGVLYAGLMVTAEGPKLIEYNVRFGDPEAQVLMMRLRSDLVPALQATADGLLDHVDLRWHADHALTVVLSAEGYPGDYVKGTEIRGLDALKDRPDLEVFHAGTKRVGGRLEAHGGRVLNVTARGATIDAAREKAYAAIAEIDWPQGYCRRDIAWRALGRN